MESSKKMLFTKLDITQYIYKSNRVLNGPILLLYQVKNSVRFERSFYRLVKLIKKLSKKKDISVFNYLNLNLTKNDYNIILNNIERKDVNLTILMNIINLYKTMIPV